MVNAILFLYARYSIGGIYVTIISGVGMVFAYRFLPDHSSNIFDYSPQNSLVRLFFYYRQKHQNLIKLSNELSSDSY